MIIGIRLSPEQRDGIKKAGENLGNYPVLGKPSTADLGLAQRGQFNPLQWELSKAGWVVLDLILNK